MRDWLEDLQQALLYIESNLTQKLEIGEIAKRAYVSPFYFQRIFAALTGVGVGEYIRCRRLALSAEELMTTDARIIDIAARYGYDSPDSFNRAFQRFHGVSPSAARKAGTPLRFYPPVQIKLTLEGGQMLEYRIEEKEAFEVVGFARMFNSDTSYQQIPEFWQEIMRMDNCPLWGVYGLCLDSNGKDFEYLIADEHKPGDAVPEGCVVRSIPASTWAVFPCRGALPEALQSVNTRIWSEWLPGHHGGCGWQLAQNMNIEFYTPPAQKPEDNYCEIWVPVKPA